MGWNRIDVKRLEKAIVTLAQNRIADKKALE